MNAQKQKRYVRRTWRPLIFMVMAAMLMLTACSSETKYAEPGSSATAFQVDGLKDISLDSTQVDKPLFVSFWATWCPYCKEEMPVVETLYQEYGDQIEFASIDLIETDSVKAVEKYVLDHGYTMPVYLDYDNLVSEQFRVTSTPTVILLDRDGKIVHTKYGSGGDESADNYRALLDEMLAVE